MLDDSSILFSVVIPAYNSENTIERALDSVLYQVPIGVKIEIIVVDDCSHDNTLTLVRNVQLKLESAPELTLTLLKNEKNMGASYSRNKGLSIAKGDYILFLDSDDYFAHNKISRISDIVTSQDVDFLFHSWEVEHHKGTTENSGGLVRVSQAFIYFNLVKNHICTPCVVVSRQNVKLFDERLHRMEDLELWTRIMLDSKRVYRLFEPLTVLGHELNQGEGLSSNNAAMRSSELKMFTLLARKLNRFALLWPVYATIHLLKRVRDAARR
ncbi:glycosyltransferase family 2 protein [Vibrio maritimus]|uniref:glycosyltransferase family 2 protein n=1 Tax=Vibrio maritimus TaxID=990268 RepID=UPI001F2249CD|nr:glycosyltransferase [Vibrio maritimus]